MSHCKHCGCTTPLDETICRDCAKYIQLRSLGVSGEEAEKISYEGRAYFRTEIHKDGKKT